jgi:hypothetical protein
MDSDHCCLPVLQPTDATTIQKTFEAAILQMQAASSDYNNISVLSTYWASDDSGSNKDSSLFITTISKLENIETHKRVIADDDEVVALQDEIVNQAKLMTGRRRLFILHYAGHAIASSTSNSLIITSRITQDKGDGPQFSMSDIQDGLKVLASMSPGLDILLVMGSSCFAAVAESRRVEGARVELMATTSSDNSGQNESSFTKQWCTAFTKLLRNGAPFTTNDINSCSNPSGFILREGSGLPITFCALPSPGLDKSQVVAFLLTESPDSDSVAHLIDYLQNAVVPIAVLRF